MCRFSGLELNYHDGPERLDQDEKEAFNQDEKEACPRVEKEAVISMDASTSVNTSTVFGVWKRYWGIGVIALLFIGLSVGLGVGLTSKNFNKYAVTMGQCIHSSFV